MSSPTPENTRSGERVPILGELHGEVTVYQPMAIREVSRGGAQVETTIPLHLNSLHQFRMELGDRSVVVKGRVAHCRVTDVDAQGPVYRSGIEFIDVSEPVAGVIAEFVESVKIARAGTAKTAER
jgi:hypothetical protein